MYIIGFWSSIVLTISVISFGICMIFNLFGLDTLYYSFISSFFIAPSFICLLIANYFYAKPERKIWGLTALCFSIIYAVLVMLVYYVQITFVKNQQAVLTEDILSVVKFQPGSALFSLDLLGYAFMALATFFGGFVFESRTKNSRWIKRLLLIHGIFFLPCLVFPAINFTPDSLSGNSFDIFGTIGYIFWCIYFSIISILSAHLYLKKSKPTE